MWSLTDLPTANANNSFNWNSKKVAKTTLWGDYSYILDIFICWERSNINTLWCVIPLCNLPWDLIDLSVVHGVEDRWVAHPLTDPQLDANAGVEEQHGRQREQEKSHHDEGGVHLAVSQRTPTLLTAHMVVIIQEVVLHLGREDRWGLSPGGTNKEVRACNFWYHFEICVIWWLLNKWLHFSQEDQ